MFSVFSLFCILIPPLIICLDKNKLLTITSHTLSPSVPLPSAMKISALSLLMALGVLPAVKGGRKCTNPKV